MSADRIHGTKILVVDDDQYFYKLMELFLTDEGYAVSGLTDGSQVLNYLMQNDGVDVILMDIMMPEMDGPTATQGIRRWEASEGRVPIRIIMVSAYPQSEGILISQRSGANSYLAKPLKLKTLSEHLHIMFNTMQ